MNSYQPLMNNAAAGKRTSVKTFSGSDDISDAMSKGDKALNENRFEDALDCYMTANEKNPDENQVYKKIGKTLFNLKDYVQAEKNYEKSLSNDPEDNDVWVQLGETQRRQGLYQQALKSFERALEIDEADDSAKRGLLETKNNILAMYSPQQAQAEKSAYASNNLQTALNMTVRYMTPQYMKDIEDVEIRFGETASMGGTSNIAQYENNKKTITVSNSYIYASPQVIAAYLAHEAVHAKDKDSYTSVREEQDAYETAAKFWIENSNGVKDPEMDYAAELYKKSPSALSSRVEEIYKLRDPSIAQTSPYHPPDKIFYFNKSKKQAAASSGLKSYDVIA